jgi:group I intron endonuclease
LEILEHCAKEDVTLREQFYLDTLKPTYNILKLAGSSLGFKHSYSTIVQMKERNNKNHPFLASFFFFIGPLPKVGDQTEKKRNKQRTQ